LPVVYTVLMSDEKRGRGRPKKIPDGKQTHLKLVLVNGEKERFDKAREAADMSQSEFTRAAVLHSVDTVLGVKPATPGPKRKK